MSKVAWVTGAGKGIGRSVALELAGRGWTVAVTSRTVEDLDKLALDASGLQGSIVGYPGSVTDREGITTLVEKIESDVGAVELAILNAGTYIRFAASDLTADDFAEQMDINVMGTVNCLAPLLDKMKARRAGHIAVVASVSGYRGLPLASAYGASKAALINMCEALKPELEHLGIGLSLINPGFIRTPLTDKNDFPMPFLMEADAAARRIVDGIMKGKFEIAMPTRFVLLLKLARCLPYALYFAITRKMLKA